MASALADLPVAALRLDASAVGTLLHLGVETVGQLLSLDRASLLARFGPTVLLRIDQALGRAPEVLRPLVFRTPIRARMDLDGPVSAIEAIWEILRRLVADVVEQLAVVGGGARRLEAEFRPGYAPAVRRTVLLSRPSREARNLFNLLRCATEQLESDDGFLTVTLAVPAYERTTDDQLTMDEAGGDGVIVSAKAAAVAVAGLVEVLGVRLGPAAVVRAEPRACHLPERAWVGDCGFEIADCGLKAGKARAGKSRPKPSSSNPKSAISNPQSSSFPRLSREPAWEPLIPDLPEGIDDPDRTDTPQLARPDEPTAPQAPLAARPLRLLPTPRELRATAAAPEHGDDRLPLAFADGRDAHRVAHAAGPERIAGLWWEGHHKTRDYYDVETTDGRRLWVFRVAQTGRWFLHGEYF